MMLKSRLIKVFSCIICFGLMVSFSYAINAVENEPLTMDEISTVTESGTYPVVIQYRDSDTGKIVSTIIYVTVYYQRTIESSEHKEAIDAHDVEIKKDYFAKLSDEDLIALAGAKAWSTKDGTKIAIVTVKRDDKNNDIGRYKVSFATANGTETTVNFIERSEVMVKKNQMYFSFLEFPYILYYELAISFVVIVPFLMLIYIYIRVRKTVNESEAILYKKKK